MRGGTLDPLQVTVQKRNGAVFGPHRLQKTEVLGGHGLFLEHEEMPIPGKRHEHIRDGQEQNRFQKVVLIPFTDYLKHPSQNPASTNILLLGYSDAWQKMPARALAHSLSIFSIAISIIRSRH